MTLQQDSKRKRFQFLKIQLSLKEEKDSIAIVVPYSLERQKIFLRSKVIFFTFRASLFTIASIYYIYIRTRTRELNSWGTT